MRVAGYWLVCLYGVFCLLAGTPLLVSWWSNLPQKLSAEAIIYRTWLQFWPAMVASILFMPIIIRDVIRMSNRFAGPIFRLKRSIHEAANGEDVSEIRLRDKDYWVDFADDVNKVTAQLQELRAQVAQLTKERDEALGNVEQPFEENEPEEEFVAVQV